MDIEKLISENVKKLIATKENFTAYQLAHLIDVEADALNSRMRNDTKWRVEYLKKIADYFGTTIDALVGKEELSYSNEVSRMQSKLNEYKKVFEQLKQIEEAREVKGEKKPEKVSNSAK